jgi:hypothetical protein
MLYLSYSGFKLFHQCPYAYWNNYVEHTPPIRPEDRLGSIFGSTVGVLFEQFYAQKWWKKKSECQAYMLGQVRSTLDVTMHEAIKAKHEKPEGVILWKGNGKHQNPKGLYTNKAELIEDINGAITRGLKIIKHYRLLGPVAEAEVPLNSEVAGYKIGGRADFIILRTKPHMDLVLIDGKGSRHRGKYLDPTQLHWYAMLYRIRYNKLPDKLAFVYWKFDPPNSVDWVEFSEYDLDQLLGEVLDTFRFIERSQTELPAKEALNNEAAIFKLARQLFRPKPDYYRCRYCLYASEMICPRGRAMLV